MAVFVDKIPFCNRVDVFEIVDEFPSDYIVWNIGGNFKHDGFVPLAKPTDAYHISLEGLKAFRCESNELAQYIKDVAQYKTVTFNGYAKVLEAFKKGIQAKSVVV